MAERKWLFLDVDGVLNAFAADHNRIRKLGFQHAFIRTGSGYNPRGLPRATVVPATEERAYATQEEWRANNRAWRRWEKELNAPQPASTYYKLTYNPQWGKELLALAKETGVTLAWATTWEEQANEWISPLVGLPQDLPVVEFYPQDRRGGTSCHWKLSRLCSFAQGERFLWFDDEAGREDRRFLNENFGKRHSRAHTVASGSGLTSWDLAFAKDFLLTPPTV